MQCFKNIIHAKFSDIFTGYYSVFQQYNLKLVNNIINIVQPYKINYKNLNNIPVNIKVIYNSLLIIYILRLRVFSFS